MKARYLTAKERKAASIVAKQMIEQELDDVAKRAQYLWMCAMLNAGLRPKTVMRVQKELVAVTEKYGELRADKCADFAMIRDLRAHGVPVEDVECEL